MPAFYLEVKAAPHRCEASLASIKSDSQKVPEVKFVNAEHDWQNELQEPVDMFDCTDALESMYPLKYFYKPVRAEPNVVIKNKNGTFTK